MRMKTSWTALAISALGLVALQAAPSGEVKKFLPDAEKIEKSERKLSKESTSKIEKALGGPIGAAEPVYEARVMVPELSGSEKTRVMVTFVNVAAPKGNVRVGVALVPAERMIVKVGIVKNEDDPALSDAGFLGQFEGFVYGDALTSPRSVLEEAEKKAYRLEEPADTELQILLGVRKSMYRLAWAWNSASEKIAASQEGVPELLDAAVGAWMVIRDTCNSIPFYTQGPYERFRKSLKDLEEGLERIQVAVGKKDFEGAGSEMRMLESQTCSKCHSSSRRVFREQRAKHGISDGFFVADFDVASPAATKQASFAAVLQGIRKAVLILSEAK